MNEINCSYGDWVAVDWGTSNLRYWVIKSNDVIHFGVSSLGMNKLDSDSYEAILVNELTDFLDPSKTTIILICGMAGSRQGWKEAPYLSVPCKPPEWNDAVTIECCDPRISVRILPGIKQDSPADVIRGEETQIQGILAKDENFDGIICLPGTHTKWIRLCAGEIVSFQTFMTGELFALLSQKSVLKHSVAQMGWDKKIFKTAVDEIMSDNKLLASKLFGLRAASILNDLSDCEARVRLSGYLIGSELSGSRPYWLGQTVCILGEDEIAFAYETGLRSQGVVVFRSYKKDISLDGLKSIYNLEKGMS